MCEREDGGLKLRRYQGQRDILFTDKTGTFSQGTFYRRPPALHLLALLCTPFFFAPHLSWAPVFLTSEMINTSCIFQLLLWLISQDSLNFGAVTVRQMNALTSDAAQNVVTLTARRTWRRVFVITTGMGNARDEPLKYEATCMSGDVMSVHPTTIRDTWLVVIHHSISRRCYKKCFERSFGKKRLCESHGYVKLHPTLLLWGVSLPTMFSPGHRRKCESRHQTWWSRRRAWLPPDE